MGLAKLVAHLYCSSLDSIVGAIILAFFLDFFAHGLNLRGLGYSVKIFVASQNLTDSVLF